MERLLAWRNLWHLIPAALLAYLFLPDLNALESDLAGHWVGIFSGNVRAHNSLDGLITALLGRVMTVTGFLPAADALALLALLPLMGIVVLMGIYARRKAKLQVGLIVQVAAAFILSGMWGMADLGDPFGMTAFLLVAAVLAALVGEWKWATAILMLLWLENGIAWGMLFVIAPVAGIDLAKRPDSREKILRALGPKYAFFLWAMYGMMALFMVPSFIQVLAEGYPGVTDISQSLAVKALNMPLLLLGLASVALAGIGYFRRLGPDWADGIRSMLPAFLILPIAIQGHYMGDKVDQLLQAILLLTWIQMEVLLKESKLLAARPIVPRVLRLMAALLALGAWLTQTPDKDQLRLQKHLAAEKVALAQRLDAIAPPTGDIITLDGLTAIIPDNPIRALPPQMPADEAVAIIKADPPQWVVLPGLTRYRMAMDSLGYIERDILRLQNLAGRSAWHAWSLPLPSETRRQFVPIPLDSITGDDMSRLPGLELKEANGRNIRIHISDFRAKAVRFGLVVEGGCPEPVEVCLASPSRDPACKPIGLPVQEKGPRVHSIQFPLSGREAGLRLELRAPDDCLLRVFDPELVL